jgi:hypothetical protein
MRDIYEYVTMHCEGQLGHTKVYNSLQKIPKKESDKKQR